jgi:hypothetical protein
MFKRQHHRCVAAVLERMNAAFLRDTGCFFGGGTAIALQIDEYRESVDLDFLCADQEGYRKLRTSVFSRGLDDLFPGKIETLRDVRADRYGIRTILAVGGISIKFEIVREARINLDGTNVPGISVPCLTRTDLFAEKLLANVDRYADKSAASRDIIDLVMMENRWGPIPNQSWDKASSAYGASVREAYEKAISILWDDPSYLAQCVAKMGIGEGVAKSLRRSLGKSLGIGMSDDVARQSSEQINDSRLKT